MGGEDGTVRLSDIRQGEAVHSLVPGEKAELARPRLGKHVSAVALSQVGPYTIHICTMLSHISCLRTGLRVEEVQGCLYGLKSLAVAAPLPPTDQEVKSVTLHDEVVMV